MSDLPSTMARQQAAAHTHSGADLEVLGKHAASRWGAGEHATLTESVISIVKEAQLSPEQVKRVVEFANTSAFLTEFKKEGSAHRVIDFNGGPANAAEILQELNSGGGGTVFDRGTSDYNHAPSLGERHSTKTASSEVEEAFAEMFGVKEGSREIAEPYADPYAPISALHSKLAGAADHLTAEINSLEVLYADCADKVYHQVKQASLEGTPLGYVMQAWEGVAPSEDYIKVAFTLLTPRLLQDGVFYEVGAMQSSLDKTASLGSVVNPEHPLVTEFKDFCETLQKLAEFRELRTEITKNRDGLMGILKHAYEGGGAVGKVVKGITDAAARASAHAKAPLQKALGDTAGGLAAGAIKIAPHVGGAIAVNEAYQRVKNSPSLPARALRGAAKTVSRQIPGTQAQREHEWEIQNGQ